MELEVPGLGTSVGETSDTNSEQSDCSWKIITDKPMPEASLTSKRVSEPEEEVKEAETKKKKEDTTKFDSCVEHLRVIVEELESSKFQNIREILRLEPSVHVERAVGTMIAMSCSTRPEEAIPSNCRKFYKERKQVIQRNVCLKALHEELKKDEFYAKFVSKASLFKSTSEQKPP